MRGIVVSLCCMFVFCSCSKRHDVDIPKDKDTVRKPSEKEVRSFDGKVVKVHTRSQFAGEVIIVGHDARWIIMIAPIGVSDAADKELVYAIHSPIMLFGQSAEEAQSKTFHFKEYEILDAKGKTVGRRLEAE